MGTIQQHSRYDMRSEYETTAYKLRSMATGYDRSALEYDTVLFWLRYKVTEYDISAPVTIQHHQVRHNSIPGNAPYDTIR